MLLIAATQAFAQQTNTVVTGTLGGVEPSKLHLSSKTQSLRDAEYSGGKLADNHNLYINRPTVEGMCELSQRLSAAREAGDRQQVAPLGVELGSLPKISKARNWKENCENFRATTTGPGNLHNQGPGYQSRTGRSVFMFAMKTGQDGKVTGYFAKGSGADMPPVDQHVRFEAGPGIVYPHEQCSLPDRD